MNEDAYWENVREELELERPRRKLWDDDFPNYERKSLYLDDEIEEIEIKKGCFMTELYEGDLLDIVEEMEGVEADLAVWDENYQSIVYMVRVA